MTGGPARQSKRAISLSFAATVLFGASSDSLSAAGNWEPQVHPLVSGKNEVFESVRAFSAQDVWAAGYYWGTIGSAIEFRTYVQHWNGIAWSRSPSRDIESAPATNLLFGVDGTATNDLWIAGYYRDSANVSRTLTEHWDGTAWSIVASPNQGSFGNHLTAISVTRTGEAWAVGDYTDFSIDYGPLAMRWDGAAWLLVAVPAPPFCDRQIEMMAVAARRSNDVLAAGDCHATTGGRQGFVLRWNGAHWRVAAGPGLIPPSSAVRGLRLTGLNEAWAVGSAGGTALTLHWLNGAWTRVPATAAGPDSSLAGAAARAPNDVWAVGVGRSTQPPFAGRLTLHWDGTGWTRFPAGDFGSLNGAAAAGRLTWAVGQELSDSLILRRRD